MIYYELRIKIDTTLVDGDTVEKYKTKVASIQEQVRLYKADTNSHLDAGFDLFVPKSVNIFAGSVSIQISHGIKCAMYLLDDTKNDTTVDVPTAFYLYPRSSTGSKTSLRLSNSVGIIDSGYRGYIIAVFDHRGGYVEYNNTNNNTSKNLDYKYYNDCHVEHINKNDRLVQICGPNLTYPIYPILVSDDSELGFTSRGDRGFGSTGR